MNKHAGLINGAFVAMDVVDGVKKTGKAFKQTNDKYNNVLGTTINKAPKQMGAANAQIANPKLASEEIDDMLKVAVSLKSVGEAAGKLSGRLKDLDEKNTKHIKGAYDAVKNKQVVKGFHEAGKAAVVTVPALAGMVGAGAGTTALMKKFDKNSQNPENELERKVVGAGVTAGLLLNAATKKRMIAPATLALDIAKKKSVKYPMNAVKKTKAGKVVADFVKQVGKQGSKAVNEIDGANTSAIQQKAKDMEFLKGKMYDFMNGKRPLSETSAFTNLLSSEKKKVIKDGAMKGLDDAQVSANWNARKTHLENLFSEYTSSKKASSEIDDLEKLAGSKTDFAKDLVVNRFLKEGLKSVPYYAAPATLGLMLNRDIRNGMKKMDEQDADAQKLKKDFHMLNNRKNETEKTASDIRNKAKRATAVALQRGAEGLGRTIFPATVTAITGRNIMNSFKKLEDDHTKYTPQEDMANKIIIQFNGTPTKSKLKKAVYKEIEKEYDLKKNASQEDTEQEQSMQQDVSIDIGDIAKGIHKDRLKDALRTEKDSKDAEKLKSKPVHVGNGVKKTFRMNV